MRRISLWVAACSFAVVGLSSSAAIAEDALDSACEGSLGDLVWSIGFGPDRCLAAPPEHQVCSWSLLLPPEEPVGTSRRVTAALLRLPWRPASYGPVREAIANALEPGGRGVSLVAMATNSGELVGCSVKPQNTEMNVYPRAEPYPGDAMGKKPTTASRAKAKAHKANIERQRDALRDTAREIFSAARTIPDVIEWTGEAPERCLGAPEPELVCTWIAVRRSPGYIQAARAADLPSSSILVPDPKIQVTCRFPSATAPRTDSCALTPVR